MNSHGQQMDRIYRIQRHVYDTTRRFFLLGRDRLLEGMNLRTGDCVLEVGCGTGRNLQTLARCHPQVRLFGLDISEQMLQTARRKRGLIDRQVSLKQADAQDFDFHRTFGLDQPFDVIFFSYSLSMIPDPVMALRSALANLTPAGSVHIVDFGDMNGWPNVIRKGFARWLRLFHVRFDPALLAEINNSKKTGSFEVGFEILGRGYAMVIRLSKKAIPSEKPHRPC